MLKIYITSVIIWFLIYRAAVVLCNDSIVKNGWMKDKKSNSVFKRLYYTVLISLIPLLRLFAFVILIVMAVIPKEKFYEDINSSKGA